MRVEEPSLALGAGDDSLSGGTAGNDVYVFGRGYGQDIIDEYIKESKYDIFLGIMKNRFGHSTKKAGSG
ncbi:MAG: hypothetical protein HC850_04600, partial [Rhodomicrobium sp.]|nr:hypothetical protein [Rhodomicrobium sp.]